MKRIFSIMTVSFALMSCTTYTGTSIAAEQPNILVMGEDADQNTVPRNSRVFRRVLNALSNELHDEGFDVFDETAVTLDDFVQGRVRRSDAEVIDIARSVKRPPVDVAVLFSIYASSRGLSYTTKIRTRIEGRLLNVRSGQRLGNFEIELPDTDNAPGDCSRECLLTHVGKQSKLLAQDLGAVLTEKLAHMVDRGGRFITDRRNSNLPTAYTLVFNGFDGGDMNEIEEFMVAFSGYKHHRPIKTSSRHNEYWYETKSNSARLNRNLRRMMDHLDLRGRVSFAGDTFSVEKITHRRDR